MSVRSHRRRRTLRTAPSVSGNDRADGADESRELLALRDRLAISIAELEAHHGAGSSELLWQQAQVEDAIERLEPHRFEILQQGWLERDNDLAHTLGDPHSECPTCCLAVAGAA